MTKPDLPRDQNLDPVDWPSFRAQGHRMLDDILDYIEGIEERPVWQPIPEKARARFREPLPHAPSSLPEAHGRIHGGCAALLHRQYAIPDSWAGSMAAARRWACWRRCWPRGSTPISAGAITCPSRSSARSLRWMRELFGFPEPASGLFVTGTSMANLMAVLIARTTVLGLEVRRQGLAVGGKRLSRLYLRRRPWLRAPGRGSRGLGQRGAAPHCDRWAPAHRSRGAGGGDRGRPGAGLHALPHRGHRRHRGCRRGGRPRRNRRSGPARGHLVPRRCGLSARSR